MIIWEQFGSHVLLAAGGCGTMPQHDHGTADDFLTCTRAHRLQAFCLEPCQVIWGRFRRTVLPPHSALDAKVVPILEGGVEGGQDAGHLLGGPAVPGSPQPRWTRAAAKEEE